MYLTRGQARLVLRHLRVQTALQGCQLEPRRQTAKTSRARSNFNEVSAAHLDRLLAYLE